MLAMTQILQLRHTYTVKFVKFLVWLSATATAAIENSEVFLITTY